MSCLTWNCRGLGIPRKVPALKRAISYQDPSFVFLCETKSLKFEIEIIARKLGFSYFLSVDCVRNGNGRRGELALLWKDDIDLTIRSFSDNHIDANINGYIQWRFTGIYGHPEGSNRWKTWRLIRALARHNDRPWMCSGDFNEILFAREKRGGCVRNENQMREFRQCLDDSDLCDLYYSGFEFTWSNKKEGYRNVQERLDRAVANNRWMENFPRFKVFHRGRMFSDHNAIQVCFNFCEEDNIFRNMQKRFRFESLWLTDEECSDIVANSWSMDRDGSREGYTGLLESCSAALTSWSSKKFKNTSRRIARCDAMLDRLQKDPQTAYVGQIRALENEKGALLRQDELYWLHRSRVNWMREGDLNTSFFHRVATGRRQRNTIKYIRGEDDRIIYGGDEKGFERIQECFVHHFSKVFTAKDELNMGRVLEAVQLKVSMEMKKVLAEPFTEDEIS